MQNRRRTVFFLLCVFILFQASFGLCLDRYDEAKLGREVFREIEKRYGLLDVPEVSLYIQQLGNRIVSAIENPSYRYKFFVVDQEVPNAFTIPGGYVFVNWGLLTILEKEGELAAILSHELAHGEARHIHKQLETQKALAVASLAAAVAGALLGTDTNFSQAIGTGAMASASAVALKYSREHEREADQLGLRFLVSAGYNPLNAINALKHLAERQWGGRPGVLDYLMTHPGAAERIDTLRVLAKRWESRSLADSYLPDSFQLAKLFLIARKYDLPTYEGFVKSLDDKGEKGVVSPVVREFARGLLLTRKGDYSAAKFLLADVWSRRPNDIFAASSLADLYFRLGQVEQARSVVERTLRSRKGNLALHYRLALYCQELGLNEQALQHFDVAKKAPFLFPDLDYRLGIVLGKLGRLGEAHMTLGDYYARRRDVSLARFHYQKALNLLKNPSLEKKVREKLVHLGKIK